MVNRISPTRVEQVQGGQGAKVALAGLLMATASLVMAPMASAQTELNCDNSNFLSRFITGKYVTEAQACKIAEGRDALVAENSKQADEIVLLRQENEDLLAQIDELAARAAHVGEAAEQASQSADVRGEEFTQCDLQRQRLVNENERLLVDLQALRDLNAQLQNQGDDSSSRIASLQSEISALTMSASDSGSALSAQIEDLRVQLETCRNAKATLDADVRAQQVQLEAMQSAADEAGALSLKNSALRSEIETLSAELEALRLTNAADHEQLVAIRTELEAAQSALASADEVSVSLANAQSAAQRQSNKALDLQRQLAEMTEARDALADQLSMAQDAALRQSNRAMDFQRQLNAANDASAALNMQLEASADAETGLSDQIALVQEAALRQSNKAIELRRNLQELQNRYDDLAAEHAASQTALEAAREAAADAQNSGALASQLVAKDVEIERLEAALAALRVSSGQEGRERSGDAMRQVVIKLNDSGSVQGAAIRNGRLVVPNAALFAPGSASLESGAGDVLDLLAEQVNASVEDDDAGNMRFIVVGHADKNPISTTRFPSNWELSAHRAAAVVRGMIDRGVDPSRVLAAGQAEHDPLVDGEKPEDLARNRRVEVFAY